MILYVIAAAVLIGALSGAGAMKWWNDSANARHEAKQAEATQIIAEQAKELTNKEAEKIADMQSAYEAGQSKSRVIYRQAIEKGQQNVATMDVFRNPACVLPADLVRELNGTRAGTGVAPAAAGSPAPVSGPGAATGRDHGVPVPATAPGQPAVGRVQGAALPADSPNSLSGTGTSRVAKNPLAAK